MSVQNQPIHTYARIKPILFTEEKVFLRKNICTILNKNQDQFGFDGVFDTECSNEDVYNQTTKNIIQHSFHGFNSCVLAYGQTSSGKTHTMKGTQQNPGIIPLCLRDIFRKIENENLQAQIIISYMEIYNQDIIDLLADRDNTVIEPREDKKRHLVLAGLKQYEIRNINDAMNLFQKGEERRKFACNNLNANSSRSHAIFRINLKVCDDDLNQIASQINLVDLAGSQGIERTKAQKISKIEGENINKSILALTKVIKTMSQRDQQWVNFRDSKLTRILQKSLCENSKSTIICMINPTIQNYQECVNTLKFGQMAAKIKIDARQNMIRSEQIKKQLNYTNIQFLPSERMQLQQSRLRIRNYEEQIQRLRRINKQLQQANYTKEESIMNHEKDYQEINRYVEEMRRADQQNRKDWWIQRQMLNNKISLLQEEVGKLAKMYSDVSMEKRKLEKNQKSIVQENQHHQNQCKQLNSEIFMLRARLSEESSKMSKPSMTSNNKPTKLTKDKPNPFQLPPYRECTDRLSPKKLSWIVQLKTQVIDLGRQVNEFTKANIEIMEDNQELKRQVEQYQSKITTERSSGKINPEALEYNEIKKLNNKIKNLKAELKNSQDRQKKNRQILKKQSHRNIIQIEEFEEWFTRKNNINFFVQISVQTENLQKQGENISTIQLKSSNKKMEIESCQIQNNFHMTPKKLSQTHQLEDNSSKGLILGKNLVLIKNQNPEDNIRASDQKEINFLSQPQFSPDENIDINIKEQKYHTQISGRSGQQRDSFLLDNLTAHNVTSSYSNNSRNFISFEESIGSKRHSKNRQKQRTRISNSKITKTQGSFAHLSQNVSNNMIPEGEKQMQI